ncbi:MAG: arylamine N-acetyltransferase [Oscillospiraceae bacterium]|nr:arylamine N-acetyltransferase [Oscillospiraceae bacterium]
MLYLKYLCLCAIPVCMTGNFLCASAEDLRLPADHIQYDENGNACYISDSGEKLTGKIYAEPNFTLGDINSDDMVNALDASEILELSAHVGAGTITREASGMVADVNQDSRIDAGDASEILVYSAELGSGRQMNPLGAVYYYADADGCLQTGFIEDSETGRTYYAGKDYVLASGWMELDGKRYYCSPDGVVQKGWEVIDNQQYYFSPKDYTMQTGTIQCAGITYHLDENGILTGKEYRIDQEIRDLLENAPRNPGQREILVYDRQYPEKGEPVEFKIRLSDRDYQIIEEFARIHFTPEMTLSECLYETWWWIHANTDYAYAGARWQEICNLSYPDAIFQHQMGQCVQYNGAMAAVLAYYGFDVYMVKGWTNPPKNTTQHYWTEVMINDTRYYVETGNQGKNGDYWQYFFIDADSVSYTQKPELSEADPETDPET